MSELGIETSQAPTETPQTTTFLDLLRGQMDCHDRARRRKRTLKERLGFKRIGCCGPAWGLRLTNNNTRERDGDEPLETGLVSESVHVNRGMNLATALAAERHYRRDTTEETASSGTLTPLRVSLMRLLEETTERVVVVEGKETERLTASTVKGDNDSVCCVCMGRKKGAALIPCGHTFCRVCSREVWLNRGSCPLCNRPIIEILDIY